MTSERKSLAEQSRILREKSLRIRQESVQICSITCRLLAKLNKTLDSVRAKLRKKAKSVKLAS